MRVKHINEEYASDKGEDLFKPTNRTASALTSIGQPLRDYAQYQRWIDEMYFIFRESLGARMDGKWPPSFTDVNTLRTAEQHDVDHGKKSKVKSKRLKLGQCLKKYTGTTTPSTLAAEKFVLVQAKVLNEIETDLRVLTWK